MKVFDKDGKFNFVDANNVFVGFDSRADCCEYFGYVIADTEIITDTTEDIDTDLEPYVFDTGYFKESGEDNGVIFRMTAPELPDLYLLLYNHHNGYYSHGFEFRNSDGSVIQYGSL
jgi:hypothetical protein